MVLAPAAGGVALTAAGIAAGDSARREAEPSEREADGSRGGGGGGLTASCLAVASVVARARVDTESTAGASSGAAWQASGARGECRSGEIKCAGCGGEETDTGSGSSAAWIAGASSADSLPAAFPELAVAAATRAHGRGNGGSVGAAGAAGAGSIASVKPRVGEGVHPGRVEAAAWRRS